MLFPKAKQAQNKSIGSRSVCRHIDRQKQTGIYTTLHIYTATI